MSGWCFFIQPSLPHRNPMKAGAFSLYPFPKMLTDSNLRSKIDGLWDKLWSGGMSNPMDAIEQLSFLLFLKSLLPFEE